MLPSILMLLDFAAIGTISVVITPEGLDYSVTDNRPHYAINDQRPHYAVSDTRLYMKVKKHGN